MSNLMTRNDESVFHRDDNPLAIRRRSGNSAVFDFRFSLAALFAAVTIFALLVPSMLASWNPKASDFAASLAGLNLCALFYGLICGVMGDSHWRAFWRGVLFYFWGLTCLLCTQAWYLSIWQRALLASPAVFYSIWLWFGRNETTYYVPTDPYEAPR